MATSLYQSQSDQAFITTMGLDMTTFQLLLDVGFKFLWDSVPIPRTDTNINGEPRVGARSLDAAGGLGLYLHYLRSPMREVGLQLIFALIPSTVNRYLTFARQILLTTLRQHPTARVGWPGDHSEFDDMSNLVQVVHRFPGLQFFHTHILSPQARHPLLVGAVGTLDGLKLPVEVSSNPYIENVTYNGWLHSHFISNVFAFLPTGMSKSWVSQLVENRMSTQFLYRGDHLCLPQRTRELARLQGGTSSVQCVGRGLTRGVLLGL